MKRLAVAVLVAGIASCALAGVAPAAEGEFAVGAGKIEDFAKFEFSAHRNQQGKVSGSGSFKPAGMERVRFDVQCLEVNGNRATLGGPPREDFFGAQFILFDVEDNGPASSPMPDQISPRFSGVPATNNCTSFAFQEGLFPITSGNFRVKDAQ